MPKGIRTQSERSRIEFTVPDSEVGAIMRLLSDKVQDLEVHAVVDMPFHKNKPRETIVPQVGEFRSDYPSARARSKQFREDLLDKLGTVDALPVDKIYAMASAAGIPKQSTYGLLARLKSEGQLKQPSERMYALKGVAPHKQRRKAKIQAARKTKRPPMVAQRVKKASKANGHAKPNGRQGTRFTETAQQLIMGLLKEKPMTGKELGVEGEKTGRSAMAVQVELPKMMRKGLIHRDDETRRYAIKETA